MSTVNYQLFCAGCQANYNHSGVACGENDCVCSERPLTPPDACITCSAPLADPDAPVLPIVTFACPWCGQRWLIESPAPERTAMIALVASAVNVAADHVDDCEKRPPKPEPKLKIV